MTVTLLCTVRDCRSPLVVEGRRFVCADAHSFDIARNGYLNLLQPQDRRSRTPGDTRAMAAARRRFLDSGHASPLVASIVAQLPLAPSAALMDAGCGEGHHLAAFRQAYGVDAHGIDISVPSIELAARRHRDCHWVVANADRFLPWAGGSFQAVTSITARMNPAEFRRILAPQGALLVAIPGTDDLVELREAILGERVERDRTGRTVELFEPIFRLRRLERLRHVAFLDPDAIRDVMATSYRGLRSRERHRLEEIGPMHVTLSRDVLLFE